MRDIDIRRTLHAALRADHESADCRVIDEFSLQEGRARIDVALINGSLAGFEIKSAQDTLRRLEHQVAVYDSVFAFTTLIASAGHVERADRVIPPHWGIAVAAEEDTHVGIDELRPPQRNPNVSSFALAQLLWRDEVLLALSQFGLDRGLRSKPRRVLWATLAEKLSQDQVEGIVRGVLKVRRGWRADLPRS